MSLLSFAFFFFILGFACTNCFHVHQRYLLFNYQPKLPPEQKIRDETSGKRKSIIMKLTIK